MSIKKQPSLCAKSDEPFGRMLAKSLVTSTVTSTGAWLGLFAAATIIGSISKRKNGAKKDTESTSEND